MFDGLFICQHVSTFSIFIKITFVWEKKQSNTGLYVEIASCHVMEFFWKLNGILWFENQIYDIFYCLEKGGG